MPLHPTLATAFLSAVLATSAAPAPAPETPPGDVPSYDAAIRASSRTAETLQGPLEGSWVLAGPGRRQLYRFQLADHGLGPGTVEGAWRDLRLAGPHAHSGVLSNVAREGETLVLRFDEAGRPVTVTVRPASESWTGRMRRGGRTTRVTLRRG